MLISQMIEKLEKVKQEKGDLPVYFITSSEFTYSLTSAYTTTVDTQMAFDHSDDLEVNQPVVMIY
jgi:hypothetical protein